MNAEDVNATRPGWCLNLIYNLMFSTREMYQAIARFCRQRERPVQDIEMRDMQSFQPDADGYRERPRIWLNRPQSSNESCPPSPIELCAHHDDEKTVQTGNEGFKEYDMEKIFIKCKPVLATIYDDDETSSIDDDEGLTTYGSLILETENPSTTIYRHSETIDNIKDRSPSDSSDGSFVSAISYRSYEYDADVSKSSECSFSPKSDEPAPDGFKAEPRN